MPPAELTRSDNGKSPVRAGAALHDEAAAGGGELSEGDACMRVHGL